MNTPLISKQLKGKKSIKTYSRAVILPVPSGETLTDVMACSAKMTKSVPRAAVEALSPSHIIDACQPLVITVLAVIKLGLKRI